MDKDCRVCDAGLEELKEAFTLIKEKMDQMNHHVEKLHPEKAVAYMNRFTDLIKTTLYGDFNEKTRKRACQFLDEAQAYVLLEEMNFAKTGAETKESNKRQKTDSDSGHLQRSLSCC